MTNAYSLAPAQLFTGTDPAQLDFTSTAELPLLDEVVGQSRAIKAIELGVGVNKPGFNLFALGPPGIGKQSTIMQHLARRAATQPRPDDWCYVNNFENPQQPSALRLPAGRGHELCLDMRRLVDDTRTSMPVAFESEDYQQKLQAIQEKFETQRSEAITALTEEAASNNIALIRGSHGFMLGPVVNGKVLDAKEFAKLPGTEQSRINDLIKEFEDKLSTLIQKMPQLAREERKEIRNLVRATGMQTVGVLIKALLDKYHEQPEVCRYLTSVKDDIVEHVDDFLEQPSAPELLELGSGELPSLRKYEVNLLIDNKDTQGAPIIYEDNPAYPKLTGRVEYESRMGMLVTDFTHIKPGALHRANGGYLLLDVLEILRQPFAWDALKRILYANKISIQSIGTLYGMIDTASLEPEPIPLDVKVVLMGERMLYYLLLQYDPGFKELFKVAADFEEDMARSPENVSLYARLIASLARKEHLPPLDATAVARLIDHSARMADDAEKLSTHMHAMTDLLQEAGYRAVQNGTAVIDSDAIQATIDAQIERASRLKERLGQEIQRETILIDTASDLVGTINGLAVIDLSNIRFANPVRITATTRIGDGKVIDIEREVKLGGASHSKGVLILSSLLAARYSQNTPLSLSASLTFEQSYGIIEGDSASMAELCALLSSLAQVPIHQYIALTGSVNQLGQAQPIGGVNEKIEGFFEVCSARGLDGRQGVIIPQPNIKHLMLHHDVVAAVEAGKFHVYAVRNVDEAIEILTGIPAGQRDAAGNYPAGSLNDRVARRLAAMADSRARFGKRERQAEDGKAD